MIIYVLMLVFYYPPPQLEPFIEYNNMAFVDEEDCLEEGTAIATRLAPHWEKIVFYCTPHYKSISTNATSKIECKCE